ncbi:MAG: YgaP family membrane protein [Halothiobacillus sp.]
MTINRMVSIMAGFMVLLSLGLAQFTHQIDLTHPTWLWLTGFIGLNLFQMGFTGFCPAAKVFKILGFKDATSACGTGSNGKGCC